MANALHQQGMLEEAARLYERVLKANPQNARALHMFGLLHHQAGMPERAVALISRSLAIEPRVAEAHLHMARALKAMGRLDDAIKAYDRAIELAPRNEIIHCDRGIAAAMLSRWQEALPSFERATWLKTNYAVGQYYRGEALKNLSRIAEAVACYQKAVAIQPDFVEAYNSLGYCFYNLERRAEALAAYGKVLQLNPHKPLVKGRVLHLKMLCCDWDGLDSLIADIERELDQGRVAATPFEWQAVGRTPQSLKRCAEVYNRATFPQQQPMSDARPDASRHKIRLGYVSGEFRNQATSHLVTGVIEHHDKSRFEVHLIDNGWDDGSDWRKRLEAAADGVLPIRNLDDEAAAKAVAAADIDILINLNGYFGEDRTDLFSRRPSPIQVNYLGFPGTLGAPYIDYIIADAHVIPEDERQHYAEKVVYLPECYQANDDKKEIATQVPSRAEIGLPERGFVFCCFNNTYKITPETFGLWMRILKQVEGSVLWLLDVPDARTNLKKEAARAGVDANRLVFAPRIPLPEHLVRHRVADLFLDSLPYNAHTTASDALWAGLPVLTLSGGTFPGRVAGSLLKALNLPELITSNAEAYEALAIELAREPAKLAAIKHKLAENRLTAPLFNTPIYTRGLEKAFETMYARWRAGQTPDHFAVKV